MIEEVSSLALYRPADKVSARLLVSYDHET
jgi:hypothetical protein